MQVSPSASLLQALSNVVQPKRPVAPAPVAATPPVQPVRPDPAPRPEASTAGRAPDIQGRPRLGQVIDIRV
jgi:hypothetical protein